MKRTIKKIISLSLALIMIFGAAPLSGLIGLDLPDIAPKAEAAETSGTCGGNLTWEFDETTGTLTISGEGDMTDYEYFDKVPWYENASNITNAIIGNGVTSIGAYAFGGTALTNIIFPDSVTSIGNEAFYCCEKLESIFIPESVTNIGACAFLACYSLSNITLPDGLVSIGNGAFASTAYYNEEANWENDGLYIGKYLIEVDHQHEGTFVIKSETELIAECAFESCSRITSILVDLSNSAYSSDNGVLFNKNKTELIQYPFGNTRTSYKIPETVTTIGYNAFLYASLLEKIIIPDSVTCIRSYAFVPYQNYVIYYQGSQEQWDNIEGHLNRGASGSYGEFAIILECDSDRPYYSLGSCGKNLEWILYADGELVISGTGDMVSYGNKLWKSYSDKIITLVINNGVTSIGENAFEGCYSLTNIAIPNSVTSIGGWAFSQCSSLSSITIPDSITRIEDGLFSSCYSLSSITIPDSVTSIGYSPFLGTAYYNDEANWNNGLLYIDNCLIAVKDVIDGSIEIASETRAIAEWVFEGCDISEITVDSKNTSFSNDGYGVLFNKDKTELIYYPSGNTRTSYEIPVSVTIIKDGAFYNCTNLTEITIPENVAKIEDSPFSYTNFKILNYNAANAETSGGAVYAETINIGPKVKNIEVGYSEVYEEPFYICGGDRFNVDPDNQYYSSDKNGILFNKDKTELMIYPRSLTDTEYVVPDSVKSIKEMAFVNNETLEKVELSNVERIGFAAFMGCENLIDLTLPDSVREIDMFAFNGTARAQKAKEAVLNDHIMAVYFEDHLIAVGCDDADATFDIKPGTKSIAGGAFMSCANLGTVNIPESVACIGDLAFAGRVSHINVHPDNPYYTIDEYGAVYTKDMTTFVSFPIASNATEYTVAATVTELTHGAFIGCYLKKINLPDSVTELNEMTFTHCTALETISIPKGVEKLNIMLLQLSGIKTAYIPKSVKMIGGSVFDSCDNLTDVYYEGTEEDWNNIVIEYDNESLENATIHFECDYHVHAYTKTVTEEATCTEDGSATYTCECGDTYTEAIPAGHVATTITVPATCKATGMSYDVCVNCGTPMGNVTVLPKADHTPGEWEIETEPTIESEGKKVKRCTVCKTVLEEEAVSKLTVIVDEETGVEFGYSQEDYEGTVSINVEETFDEVALHLLERDTDTISNQIFNITLTLDGQEIQPESNVVIRIPLPEGFDPKLTNIYYLNSQTGEVELIESTVEDGYIIFTTNHFSYYAVVQESNGSLTIKTPTQTAISYGDSIILHANITGTLPTGAYIEWTADNSNFSMSASADGMTCTVSPESSGDTTFTATVYDANGNEISADTQEMTSKASFFQKIIAFFKKLFGLTKVFSEALSEII